MCMGLTFDSVKQSPQTLQACSQKASPAALLLRVQFWGGGGREWAVPEGSNIRELWAVLAEAPALVAAPLLHPLHCQGVLLQQSGL